MSEKRETSQVTEVVYAYQVWLCSRCNVQARPNQPDSDLVCEVCGTCFEIRGDTAHAVPGEDGE